MNGLAEALEQLRGLHPPPAPGLWPPALGWWAMAALVLVALVWSAWQLWRRRQRARWKRRVLCSLEALQSSERVAQDPMWLVAEVSVLLRRVALRGHDREEVATLSGEGWLEFLDRTGGEGTFTRGAGRVLATGPYARHEAFDTEGLIDAARHWLERNLHAREHARLAFRFPGRHT